MSVTEAFNAYEVLARLKSEDKDYTFANLEQALSSMCNQVIELQDKLARAEKVVEGFNESKEILQGMSQHDLFILACDLRGSLGLCHENALIMESKYENLQHDYDSLIDECNKLDTEIAAYKDGKDE